MSRDHLIRQPIVDRNGRATTVHRKATEMNRRGETAIERQRRLNRIPGPDRTNPKLRNNAEQVAYESVNSIQDVMERLQTTGSMVQVGGLTATLSTGVVHGMRQLREVDAKGLNIDFSRYALGRLPDVKLSIKPQRLIDNFKQALREPELYRGNLTEKQLDILDDEVDDMEIETRAAISERKHDAAAIYADVAHDIAEISLSDEPVEQARYFHEAYAGHEFTGTESDEHREAYRIAAVRYRELWSRLKYQR